ncbi:MAG: tRNA dimethylallyltransferase [Woeseia sp.]|nr:MAG: tRNA dimethylallyltransferase [Woeseia sp.]
MTQSVITLRGPTASGKTHLTINLSNKLPLEIISVDSVMVYRGLNIGSAKPDQQTLENYPHHLIDICDPSFNYSLGNFYEDVNKAIKIILSKRRTPILVGGTMMYFNALSKGLSDLPSSDHAIRKKIEDEADEIGWPELHKRLSKIDPVSGEKIKSNDKQRIQRALEVYELSGKPLSSFFSDNRKKSDYEFFNISLFPDDRETLYKRIEDRFDQMLDHGLVDEVRALLNRPELSSSHNSMKSIGYKEICAHLEGKQTLIEAKEKSILATRRLAKRQLTWLRSLDDSQKINTFDNDLNKKLYNLISDEINH